ncbi:protein of unknown function DUF990 [Isosphaera pallida ATCC 43644]|uniref:ABC transporter permease n=1 Tax=Isosphaera pallida (strain ATCC 43644 / DSM 9630 / IS1B) TaxID=575540 RepID=E8QZ27_ISOPI|nr:ABC-2 family transporter protein [Isosphaera pallida]ADV63169.1 protein of unknown function DUF990 [Isosphaera pallida ATCC 43644]
MTMHQSPSVDPERFGVQTDAADRSGRVGGLGRYPRLLGAMLRFSLTHEMAFRANFLIKVLVEVIWLGILLIFYRTVFAQTDLVGGWNQSQYLFFVGCFFALNGLVEAFFLESCQELSDLIRTGDLDSLLLKPIDEQFLISIRRFDWGTVPNVAMGAGVMLSGLSGLDSPPNAAAVAAFVVTFICGLILSYSFLIAIASCSVWMIRNQGLLEIWWLVSNLVRHPREIYKGPWGEPLGWFLTFVAPFLLIVHVPASSMVRVLDWNLVGYTVAATVVVFLVSRRLFRWSIRHYRSAGG